MASSQITSKIWPINLHQVEKALDETLAKLGTDYLDRKLPYPLPFNYPCVVYAKCAL